MTRAPRARRPAICIAAYGRSTTAPSSAEGSDESSPATHIFAARGTAFSADPPPFSACAGGTSLAAGLSTPRLRGEAREREVAMEENPGNLIRGVRQKPGMTQEESAHETAATATTSNRWATAH